MTRDSWIAYEAVVYHDTEDDAAVADKHIGYFLTRATATRAVNASRDDHWQTGSVYRGTYYPAVFGKSPDEFETDLGWSWFVGTDGKAVR